MFDSRQAPCHIYPSLINRNISLQVSMPLHDGYWLVSHTAIGSMPMTAYFTQYWAAKHAVPFLTAHSCLFWQSSLNGHPLQ